MQTFIKVLTFISMLAVIGAIIMGVVTIIAVIIGLIKKDYTYFKRALKILAFPVGTLIAVILLYAIGRSLVSFPSTNRVPTQIFAIYKEDRHVLTVKNEPGSLHSLAPPDPAQPQLTHPFLTGYSKDASSEHELFEILQKSTNFQDYLQQLETAGYAVKPVAVD